MCDQAISSVPRRPDASRFAGCTFENHRECMEYPTIHGPCSWAHSAWQTLDCFAFATVSMAVMMVGALWVAGVIGFGKGGER